MTAPIYIKNNKKLEKDMYIPPFIYVNTAESGFSTWIILNAVNSVILYGFYLRLYGKEISDVKLHMFFFLLSMFGWMYVSFPFSIWRL